MKANYIIFHPDDQRERVTVNAEALIGKSSIPNWMGDIFVDSFGGNEDPFVFNPTWLYSYCHAAQLRRKTRISGNYLQPGSKIIFVNGQSANKNILEIDTIFLIENVRCWGKKPLKLPQTYKGLRNNDPNLWTRHFESPFLGIHSTVSHTYEADMWKKGKSDYSFLPLITSGKRVSIPFPKKLSQKIKNKVKGKCPVLLTDKEMQNVCAEIDKVTKIKVLKINRLLHPIPKSNAKSHHSKAKGYNQQLKKQHENC